MAELSHDAIAARWPSTRVMEEANSNELRPRNHFFTNTFFSDKDYQREEKVMYSRHYKNRGVMPFGCPCDPAPSADVSGTSVVYEAEFGHFALKTEITPCKPSDRINPGAPWMDLPPEDRVDLQVMDNIEFLEDARQNRIERMILQQMTTGEMSVSVYDQILQKFVTKEVVNFKRQPRLNGGTIEFPCDDPCSFVLSALRRCAREIICTEYMARPDNIIFGWKACDHFMDNPKVCELMEKNRDQNPRIYDFYMDLTPKSNFGSVEFMGRLGQFDIWCHSDFLDKDGALDVETSIDDKDYLFPPDGMLMLDGQALRGLQLYGPTYSCETMEPMDRYMDVIVKQDPDMCWNRVMMTTIPLARRINSSCFKTVKLPQKASSKKAA